MSPSHLQMLFNILSLLLFLPPLANSSEAPTWIKAARLYGFHGLELYGIKPDTSTKNMKDMGILSDDWRSAINKELKNSNRSSLILTMAGHYLPSQSTTSYPMDSIQRNLDWVHIGSYDYHLSTKENFTGAHSALYDPSSNTNTDYGIKEWIRRGLPAKKMVLGLAYHGYVWTLVDPKDNAIGSPARGRAITADGLMSYKYIKSYLRSYGVKGVYNASYVANYCIIGSFWIGFDDAEAIKTKVSYAREKGLLGYKVWQVPNDDNWVLSKADMEANQATISVNFPYECLNLFIGQEKTTKLVILIAQVNFKQKRDFAYPAALYLSRKIKNVEKLNAIALKTYLSQKCNNPSTAAQEEGKDKENKQLLLEILLPTSAVVTLLLGTLTWYLRRRLSKWKALAMRVMATRTKSRYLNLQAFGFTDIKVATSNFSHENKLGEGGFGPVYKDSKSMEFMDPLMDDTNSGCKLLRCMQVALLCVQEKWEDRPTMLDVYSMLKNEIEDVSAPKRPASSTKTDMDEENHHKSREEICSANFATMSQVMPI
ncbi:hypothetical protein RHMOL_Rhmol01G0034200 [Rhododendron molle]|uniref:Uncharacterized protein n=1 Tax=Rhododendron molle TaxID=49168 RepID=A0ACC0PZJ3_RHOML|nr:hypothetical protein RHMOL_Rhmol01G0034200 [Rhododendron molle]